MMKSFTRAFRTIFLQYEGVEGLSRLMGYGIIVVGSVASWLLIYFSFDVKAADWEVLATIMILAGIAAGLLAVANFVILIIAFLLEWKREAYWLSRGAAKYRNKV